MPKLWTDTIEEHRRAVREATLDTTAALVAEHGLAAVTMSRIARETGIGRATLYKYFPDVESILVAWHQRNIARHLAELAESAAKPGTPGQRVQAVLEAFAARIASSPSHTGELAALVHRGAHMAAAQRQLRGFLTGLLAEAAAVGEIRDDVTPDELAGYCLHALTAASTRPTKDAIRRLVDLTMAALRPPV